MKKTEKLEWPHASGRSSRCAGSSVRGHRNEHEQCGENAISGQYPEKAVRARFMTGNH